MQFTHLSPHFQRVRTAVNYSSIMRGSILAITALLLFGSLGSLSPSSAQADPAVAYYDSSCVRSALASFGFPPLHFVPFPFRDILLRHGVDPNGLYFKSAWRDFEEVWINYKGKTVGEYSVEKVPNSHGGKYIRFAFVYVDPEFENKGMGTLLYLLAARTNYQRTGQILQKSISVEPAAEAVWNRLVTLGYASKDRGGTITMNPAFLESNALDPLDSYFKSRFHPGY